MTASACRSEICQRQRPLPSAPKPKPLPRLSAWKLYTHARRRCPLKSTTLANTRRRTVIEPGTRLTSASSDAASIGQPRGPVRARWRCGQLLIVLEFVEQRREVDPMILNVALASEVPIYQQLRDQIVEAIADGVLDRGQPVAGHQGARRRLRDQLPHREQGVRPPASAGPDPAQPQDRPGGDADARRPVVSRGVDPEGTGPVGRGHREGFVGGRGSRALSVRSRFIRYHAARGHAMTLAIALSSGLSALVLVLALVLPP